MLKDKSKLEHIIGQEINHIIIDNDKCDNIYQYLESAYRIPEEISSDYITTRHPLSEATEFILFCIQEAIEKEIKIKSIIPQYFTDKEIKFYSTSIYEVEELKFPLVFKMIEVNKDQWIGKIDVQTLMKMRAAQIINYNANAQRTMQRIVKGNTEIYKIKLNQTAVNSIEQSFRSGNYISTPLTMNIPAEEDSEFYYDEKSGELIIYKLDHFDILDGYHRYIAACKVSDTDKSFDYIMEFRIVNFFEDRARQFIYQEDQKTKMSKIDSDSMNMNDPGNIVAERLDESPRCNLKGLISRNKGIINLAELSGLINYFYFKDSKKKMEQSLIVRTIKELTINFNALSEYDTKYMENEYSYKQLCAVMFVFNYAKEKGIDEYEACLLIEKMMPEVDNLDNKKFYARKPKKTIMNDFEKIIEKIN